MEQRKYKVYCRDCTHFAGYFYKDCKSTIVCDVKVDGMLQQIRDNRSCYNYKRKWYLFWRKQ